MRTAVSLSILGLLFITSCDKVENIYPPYQQTTDLDYSLYPGGGEQEYLANEWPTFVPNTNTDRNLLIEDFTGHKCNNCPNAATVAEGLKDANPGRVYVASIHTSPEGMGSFQTVDLTYTNDFTCPEGLDIGLYFGWSEWAGSPFLGNPFGTVSRNNATTGFPVQSHNTWASTTSNLLTANDLKVNIQAEVNYFTATRGLFLHTELDVLDAGLTDDLYTVVYVMEDTLVGPQKMPDNSTNYTYKHHDIMRDCIDSRPFGQKLDDAHKDANGKYYFNYSYKLPDQYDPDNMYLLIYVRNAATEEILQVIKKTLD
jgi:hypothetical protein